MKTIYLCALVLFVASAVVIVLTCMGVQFPNLVAWSAFAYFMTAILIGIFVCFVNAVNDPDNK